MKKNLLCLTNEQRVDALLDLQNLVQTGLATNVQSQKYNRCMEILTGARARTRPEQT